MAASSVAEPPHAEKHAATKSAKPGILGLVWRFRFVLAGVVTMLMSLGAYLYLTLPSTNPDAALLRQVLQELDTGNLEEAQAALAPLDAKGYLDTEFPGGVAFAKGWLAFRAAAALPDEEQKPAYVAAAAFLKEAETQTVPAARHSQWAMALGVCLVRGGLVEEGIPHLKDAIEHDPVRRYEASIALIDTWLDGHDSDLDRQASNLEEKLLKDPRKIPAEFKDRLWLQRALVLLRLGQKADAEKVLANVSADDEAQRGKTVVQSLISYENDPARTLAALKPVADYSGGTTLWVAQAAYLRGHCARRLAKQPGVKEREALEWLDKAIVFYEGTAERFEQSPEAIPARLAAADALRELGRVEEALETYGRILRGIPKPEAFRNRWLSLKEVQERIVQAWSGWNKAGRFAEATALADLMPPVVPRQEADDLAARTHEQWVARVEQEFSQLAYAGRKARRPELLQRYRACAEAWSRSAESREFGNADAHAQSADRYVKGEDFVRAIAQLTPIIEQAPPNLVTTALLRRGQAYLDLDRQAEAIADFQALIDKYPSDPNTAAAQFHLGSCHLERNDLPQAEAAWRKLLTSTRVDPQSEVWRLSLYNLSKLLFLTADAELRATQATRTDPAIKERREKAYAQLDEVIRRMDEYLDRYPNSPDDTAVRALLGRTLHRSIDHLDEQMAAAETDSARADFLQQRQSRLDRAIRQFEPLQAMLLERHRRGELEDLEQAILREACFELAHCRFARNENQPAIDAYQICVARYPHDPESLVALVQIANCYRRTKDSARVVSTLAQARLMLKQLPDASFTLKPGAMSRDDWSRWLAWAIQLHQSDP